MQAPSFWDLPRDRFSAAAAALAPLAWAYGVAHAWRWRVTRPQKATVPVVCIGNLVVGGAGKTPTAIAVAKHLLCRGVTVHFVTRGYRGREAGPLRVDLVRHEAGAVGDEALLLAQVAPTWVARDRVAGAHAAAAAGAQVVVLDDGFQNPNLAKDVALVVIDAEYGLGNGRLLPAGPLRETAAQGMARASAIVLIGAGSNTVPADGLPVLRAALAAEAESKTRLSGARTVAFAGIARPARFFATLRATGATVVSCHAFPDHHRYSAREVIDLRRIADLAGARLVTTAKDWARLAPRDRAGIEVLDVSLAFAEPAALDRVLAPVLSATVLPTLSHAPSTRPYRRRSALADYAETAVAAMFLWLCGRLSLEAASALGGAAARTLGPLVPRSRLAVRNVARVFPGQTPQEVRALVRAMWDHLGRIAAETAHLRSIDCYDPNGPVEVRGAEHLDALKATGRGGIIFSGHVGQWDLPQLATRQRGVDATVVYREINNPSLNRLMARPRAPLGTYQNKGRAAAKAMIEGLRTGSFFSMLVDQKMNNGIAAPFFGRPAMTAPAIAQFAVRDDVPLLPARCERLGGARFRITFYPPVEAVRTGDRARDVAATLAKVNALIEGWIRERPEQWLWLHNRWPE